MIYHITSRANWHEAQAQAHYTTPSLQREGFIHCSTRDQVPGVANDFYRGQKELLLLCIDEQLLRAPLVWEAPAHPNRSLAAQDTEGQRFPHLYGALNLDAVAAVFDFCLSDAGNVLSPIPS